MFVLVTMINKGVNEVIREGASQPVNETEILNVISIIFRICEPKRQYKYRIPCSWLCSISQHMQAIHIHTQTKAK